MEKSRTFKRVFFDQNIINDSLEHFKRLTSFNDHYDFLYLKISFENEAWHHDNLEEFFADYRKEYDYAHISIKLNEYNFELEAFKFFNFNKTTVSITGKTRQEIETILTPFEANWKRFYTEPSKEETIKENPTIFLGHGRDPQWKELKDHLHEKHNFPVEAYEIGERAGHVIRDILESMMDNSSIAFLIMTGEDKVDKHFRARQNVIHEIGLFQGRLGFHRAIIILEEGTEEFSNINGVQQIRFKKGRIRETFGDILAVIKRESDN